MLLGYRIIVVLGGGRGNTERSIEASGGLMMCYILIQMLVI